MNETKNVATVDSERAVRERYSAGAQAAEAALCCPVDYDPRYLKVLPEEILERDYGCGDPSRYLRRGDRVVDLGAGGGKICYIASQIVGPEGRVTGVDMNPEMLALARRWRDEIGERVGWHNVEFRRGRIQDLALDLDLADAWLREHPVASAEGWLAFDEECRRLRAARPMIATGSVDVVVSNCVLNLVSDTLKKELFAEIFRVLAPGGRAAISDIVSDEDVPAHMKADPTLWSGCISGAMRDDRFLAAFADAGFQGVTLDKLDAKPWRTVEGVEFRAATVLAYKPEAGAHLDRKQAVIYKGPFRSVTTDDGRTYKRGERSAVSAKSFAAFAREPYAALFEHITPRDEVPVGEAADMGCGKTVARRDPRETKGAGYSATTAATERCTPSTGGKTCC